jgi:hypothetical protein
MAYPSLSISLGFAFMARTFKQTKTQNNMVVKVGHQKQPS